MKLIGPEGVEPFVFYAHNESLPKEGDVACGLKAYNVSPYPYMQHNLRRLSNVRFILVRWTRTTTGLAYYLHWESDAETADIDQKVSEDRYTDADFARSVRTNYSPHICYGCSRRWHSLVMVPGAPYLPVKGLYEKKIASRDLKPCPACKTPPRQMVVMYMEEIVDDDSAKPT